MLTSWPERQTELQDYWLSLPMALSVPYIFCWVEIYGIQVFTVINLLSQNAGSLGKLILRFKPFIHWVLLAGSKNQNPVSLSWWPSFLRSSILAWGRWLLGTWSQRLLKEFASFLCHSCERPLVSRSPSTAKSSFNVRPNHNTSPSPPESTLGKLSLKSSDKLWPSSWWIFFFPQEKGFEHRLRTKLTPHPVPQFLGPTCGVPSTSEAGTK